MLGCCSDDVAVCLCSESVICLYCECLAYMESALDSVVTVDDCYVYVRKCRYKLLRCELFEPDVERILDDIFYCSIDACILIKYKESFLCEEEQCSCFVCNVVGNCDDRTLGKLLKIINPACINTERFIVNGAYGYEI